MVYLRVELTETEPIPTKMLMMFITNYRSIFRESFLCPDIPHLKRAGFTDMFDKISSIHPIVSLAGVFLGGDDPDTRLLEYILTHINHGVICCWDAVTGIGL